MEGRGSGEDGEARAANYIFRAFTDLGLESLPGFPSYSHSFSFRKRTIESFNKSKEGLSDAESYDTLRSQNIIGLLRSPVSRTPQEYVLVIANYDHLGHGIWSHRLLYGKKNIFPGANDNASGVAALIEIARSLSFSRDSLGRDVIFIAIGAGEESSEGLYSLFNDPMFPYEKTQACIELNSVGRYRDTLLVGGYHSSTWFNTIGGDLMECLEGNVLTTLSYEHSQLRSLDQAQLPHLLITTGIPSDHHRVTDTPEKLDLASMSRIASTVVSIVKKLSNSSELIPYTQIRNRPIPVAGGEAGPLLVPIR